MRGYTLVELLTSLSIGMVLLASTIKFGLSFAAQMSTERARLAVRGNLNMAAREWTRLVRGIEPDFLNAHPILFSPVHAGAHIHGSTAFNEVCEDLEESACLTVFDIRLLDEEPVIYRVDQADWPERVKLVPVDDQLPPGPADGVEEMSVLLFYGENQTFCALVSSVLGVNVILAGPEKQLWSLPEAPELENYEVIHLGFLDVTHVYLKDESGWGRKLVYQPFSLYQNDWGPDRSRSSYGQFHAMEWVPCDGGAPDRLMLIGQAAKAPPLSSPIWFGNREYFREAFCVTWEF